MSPDDHSGPTDADLERAARKERLQRFLGPVAERDEETVRYWRAASPSEHARAMIELSEYATEMARMTGHGKDPGEFFPGFARLRSDAERGRG